VFHVFFKDFKLETRKFKRGDGSYRILLNDQLMFLDPKHFEEYFPHDSIYLYLQNNHYEPYVQRRKRKSHDRAVRKL
jgi:hypothetical protein